VDTVISRNKNNSFTEKVEAIKIKERARIRFVLERDGEDKTIEFIKRMILQYQKCLRYKNPAKTGAKYHYARNNDYLHEFVGSIIEGKSFLEMMSKNN
jgi:hypothetical protein